MRKEKPLPTMALVVAVAATVGACSDQKPAQRDAYRSIGDCLADWKDYKLCKDMTEDERQQANRSGGAGGFFYWGPHYYGTRSVFSGGSNYVPSTNRSQSTATYSTSKPTASPSFAPRTPSASPVSSTPTSRGGFGATGRGVGVSS